MSCCPRDLHREVQGVAKAAEEKAVVRGRATALAFRAEKAKAAENAPNGPSDF